jgi:hypothetical protein
LCPQAGLGAPQETDQDVLSLKVCRLYCVNTHPGWLVGQPVVLWLGRVVAGMVWRQSRGGARNSQRVQMLQQRLRGTRSAKGPPPVGRHHASTNTNAAAGGGAGGNGGGNGSGRSAKDPVLQPPVPEVGFPGSWPPERIDS